MAVIDHYLAVGDDGEINQDDDRNHTEIYEAETNSASDSEVTLLIDSRTPKPYMIHRHDSKAWVNSVKASQTDDSGRFWEIVVDYIAIPEDGDNPLSRPDNVGFSGRLANAIAWRTYDGKPNVNYAGDLFNPPPEKLDPDLVITVSRNVASVPKWFIKYPGAVNSDATKIRGLTFNPYTLIMTDWNVGDEEQEENGIKFIELSFSLAFKKTTWHTYTPNRGYRELVEKSVGTNSAGKEILREFPEEIMIGEERPTEPVWLDGDGKAYRVKDSAGNENVRMPVRTKLETSEMIFIKRMQQDLMPFNALKIRKT